MTLLTEGEDAAKAALQDLFKECGEIVRIRMPTDRDSGELKGFAYVEFDSTEAKTKAGEFDGSEACGGWLKVGLRGLLSQGVGAFWACG